MAHKKAKVVETGIFGARWKWEKAILDVRNRFTAEKINIFKTDQYSNTRVGNGTRDFVLQHSPT